MKDVPTHVQRGPNHSASDKGDDDQRTVHEKHVDNVNSLATAWELKQLMHIDRCRDARAHVCERAH